MLPDRIETLENENATLRERIANLEEALFGVVPMPFEFGLTATEARLVSALLHRELLTKSAAMAALYHDFGRDEPEIKIIDVFVYKARKKLEPWGIEIKTIFGQGYFLEAEAKKLIRSMMQPAQQPELQAEG